MIKKLTLICLLFISCRSASGIIHFTNCQKELQKELQTNWKLQVDSAYYKVNHNFINRLETKFKKCIHSTKKIELVSLFGKPSRENSGNVGYKYSSSMDYFTSPSCNVLVNNKCEYLIFYLDSNDVVGKFEVVELLSSEIEDYIPKNYLCGHLRDSLIVNWKFSTLNNSYNSSEGFISSINDLFGDCIIGRMDTLAISEMFGKYYIVSLIDEKTRSMNYPWVMKYPLLPIKNFKQKYLGFYFNELKIIQKIEIID